VQHPENFSLEYEYRAGDADEEHQRTGDQAHPAVKDF
jgi:hypothetical protein